MLTVYWAGLRKETAEFTSPVIEESGCRGLARGVSQGSGNPLS